jgi:hypothetical protein
LNVTPTGRKTFLTGIVAPVDGWAYSVRVESLNDCWTSTVSPVSMNLYTYVGMAVPQDIGVAPKRDVRPPVIAPAPVGEPIAVTSKSCRFVAQ